MQKYNDWGLQVVHVELNIKSPKSVRFRRILQSTDNLLNTHFGVITKSAVSKFRQMGSDYPRIIKKNTHNFFCKELNMAFSEYIDIHVVQKSSNIHQTPVWFNPQIKMVKKSIFFLVLYKRGLYMYLTFFNEDGELI